MAKKILILAANPRDTSKLRVNQEFEAIKEIFKGNKKFIVKENLAVTPDNLFESLSEHKPNIVHFIGHGKGEYGVVLEENDDGLNFLVNNEGFTGIFEGFNIEFLYLNFCKSNFQAVEIFEHIKCIIGMQKDIKNNTAKKFATEFYKNLATGKNYKSAFNLAFTKVKIFDYEGAKIPKILCNEMNSSWKYILLITVIILVLIVDSCFGNERSDFPETKAVCNKCHLYLGVLATKLVLPLLRL